MQRIWDTETGTLRRSATRNPMNWEAAVRFNSPLNIQPIGIHYLSGFVSAHRLKAEKRCSEAASGKVRRYIAKDVVIR